MSRGHDWSDERVEFLRKMRADGVSFTLCAEALGVSRNAVIGKAAREGILGPPRNPVVRKEKPKKERVHRYGLRLFKTVRRRIVMPELPMPACDPVSFMQLRSCHCRWIIDEQDKTPGKGTLYCGAQVIAGKSWCVRHYQRVIKIDCDQMLEAAE